MTATVGAFQRERNRSMRRVVFAAFAVGACAFLSPARAGDVRTARVNFAPGASRASIQGVIKGRQSVNYKVGASAGQTMAVSLSANNFSTYFNIFEPGAEPGRDAGVYGSDTGGNRFEGPLAKSGDYTIQVYLFRNAARRGVRSRYRLDVAITGPGASAPAPAAGDAKVAGTEFNATGEIPCARYEAQPMHQCRFGVIRRGKGDATVRVFWPGGGERNIYFENGRAASSDSSAPIRSEKTLDLNRVFIGATERFEIPDAVLFGG
jgi:hypothetical protein